MLCIHSQIFYAPTRKFHIVIVQYQVRIQGGARGPGPPLTLGFEAPKLSIFGPYLIFP